VAEVWGSEDAPSQIPIQPEEEDFGEEMGRINGRKYGFPKNQRPNRMVERAPKRLAGGGGASAKSERGTAIWANT